MLKPGQGSPTQDTNPPATPPGALQREFEADAQFGLVFVVLTLGSALIATLGLLANSVAVVIGAMVVASWILPCSWGRPRHCRLAGGGLAGEFAKPRKEALSTLVA